MSESEDAWGENEYCDPHDDDQYARNDGDDWENVDWGAEYVQESLKQSGVKTQAELDSLTERVCRNCKNFDQHIDISFCRCFWQGGSFLALTSEDLLVRAKNCEFYKNKYE
jgi:hypothetical protein